MRDTWRWSAALREHETAVREFLVACGRIAPDRWQRAPAPGKWTGAAVVLHVCRAYELGRNAAAGGESMRLKVSPSAALISRVLILPVVLATHRFPRGARSPREVFPDAAEASLLLPDVAARRLHDAAEQAAEGLRQAAACRPMPRMTHAYFGPLAPLATLRLLTAHTVHHARDLTGMAGGRTV
jgi:DinB superfamily